MSSSDSQVQAKSDETFRFEKRKYTRIPDGLLGTVRVREEARRCAPASSDGTVIPLGIAKTQNGLMLIITNPDSDKETQCPINVSRLILDPDDRMALESLLPSRKRRTVDA